MSPGTPSGPPGGPLRDPGRVQSASPSPTPMRSESPWRSRLTHVGTLFVGLVIGGAVGLAAGGGSTGDGAARPAVTVTVTKSSAVVPEAAMTPSGGPSKAAQSATADEIPGDGTFIVGEDIEPGTYRSDGPQGGEVTYCSWERLSGTGRDAEDIIAAGGGSGQDAVTVKEGDVAFSTHGCRPWKRVG